jgi:O-antigen ligase
MSESSTFTVSFAQSINWEARKKSIFSALFFCAFLSLCIRGVYEVTIGKVLAYGAQVGLWSLVLFSSVMVFRYRATNGLSTGIVLTFLFGLSAMVSSVWTLDVAGFQNGIIATLVNVYLLLLFVVGYGFQTEAFTAKPIMISMALPGVVLPIFGLVQLLQIPIFELPGRSILRPPSLTGSYLHFPLLCGILAICLLEGAKALRWRSLYFVSFLCLIGVLISGGRSGTVVLLGTCALYIVFEFSKRSDATKLKFAAIALVSVLAFAAVFAMAYQFVPTLQRISRLWDLQEGANTTRLIIWTNMISYWLHTNLWFGEFTGMVGNTTNNVGGNDYTNEVVGGGLVAESGVLEQLINFGVLGFLSFYGVIILSFRAIEKQCTFLRALFISAMIQTLFYQSTEVLPYMAMLAFLPQLSRSLLIAGRERYSNQGR